MVLIMPKQPAKERKRRITRRPFDTWAFKHDDDEETSFQPAYIHNGDTPPGAAFWTRGKWVRVKFVEVE